MRLLATILVFASVATIDNLEIDIQNKELLQHEFANLFEELDDELPNLKRMKRAFDKSQNTMEMDDDLLTGPEKRSGESSEEKKMKLELGQKYTKEFHHLLKMDGIELDQAVVDQLNHSLVDMFAETMKETMSRHNSMNGHPRFMLQSDFHIGFKAFQLLMRKRVTAWLDKINEALPSILIHDEHSKIESPKGKAIYKGLINHKSKTMRRAIRSFINHNFKRLEYQFLNGVTFHKKVTRPTTILHSTELFG